MSVPSVAPFEAIRGDTFTTELTFWADTDKTQPYPLDQAQELLAEIRANTGSPVIATFVLTLTPPNILRFDLDSDITAIIPFGGTVYKWDLQSLWAGTPLIVRTLVQGTFKVVGDITDSDGSVKAGKR